METLAAPPRRAASIFENPSWLLIAVLVSVRLLFAGFVSINVSNFGQESDIARFRQIATTPGVPYRDFPVEYAPVETAVIEAVAKGGPGRRSSE